MRREIYTRRLVLIYCKRRASAREALTTLYHLPFLISRIPHNHAQRERERVRDSRSTRFTIHIAAP